MVLCLLRERNLLPRLVGLGYLPGASTSCGEEIHTPALYLAELREVPRANLANQFNSFFLFSSWNPRAAGHRRALSEQHREIMKSIQSHTATQGQSHCSHPENWPQSKALGISLLLPWSMAKKERTLAGVCSEVARAKGHCGAPRSSTGFM